MVGKPKNLIAYKMHVVQQRAPAGKARLPAGDYLVADVKNRSLTVRYLEGGQWAHGTVKSLFGVAVLSELPVLALPPVGTIIPSLKVIIHAHDEKAQPQPLTHLRHHTDEQVQRHIPMKLLLEKIHGRELITPAVLEPSGEADSSSSSSGSSEPPVTTKDDEPLPFTDVAARAVICKGLHDHAEVLTLLVPTLELLEKLFPSFILDHRAQDAWSLESRAGAAIIQMLTIAHISDLSILRVEPSASIPARLELIRIVAKDIAASLQRGAGDGISSDGSDHEPDVDGGDEPARPVPYFWPLTIFERGALHVVRDVAAAARVSRRRPPSTYFLHPSHFPFTITNLDFEFPTTSRPPLPSCVAADVGRSAGARAAGHLPAAARARAGVRLGARAARDRRMAGCD